MGERLWDRRMGERHAVDVVDVRWHVPAADPEDAGPGATPVKAYVVDLSVSGLGVVGRANPELATGVVVDMEFRGMTGPVVIRRVAELDGDPGHRMYGVEFAVPDAPLNRAIFDAFLTDHSRRSEWSEVRTNDPIW